MKNHLERPKVDDKWVVVEEKVLLFVPGQLFKVHVAKRKVK